MPAEYTQATQNPARVAISIRNKEMFTVVGLLSRCVASRRKGQKRKSSNTATGCQVNAHKRPGSSTDGPSKSSQKGSSQSRRAAQVSQAGAWADSSSMERLGENADKSDMRVRDGGLRI